MAYEYNPLIKDCLQKKSAVSPEDIQHIEDEIATINESITDINGDLRNKVPKFFTSIEEIEIGEIGEYQGETNETFINGYFYKRLNGGLQPNFVEISQLVAQSKCVSSYKHIVCYSLLTSGELPSDVINLDVNFWYEVSVSYVIDGNEYSIHFLMFPPEVGLKSSYSIPSIQLFNNQEGYLFDYVFYDEGHYVGYNPLSPKTPIFEDENGLYFIISDDKIYIKDIPIINKYSWGLSEQFTFYSGFYSPINGNYVESRLLKIKNWLFAFIVPINTDDLVHDGTFDVIQYNLSYWESVDTPFDVYGLSYEDVPAFLRIDTQPALDPDNFATAAQGAKADTALQQVVHGTDGLYVTTTVTQKANNEQTIYIALKLQDIATADDTNNGVAVAADVRNYLNIIAATSEAYGVMWDTANPSPTLTRIGNMTNHALLPVQSQMIGGVMADDGTFTPFSNQNDWTQATQARDGSDGQVMVRIPRHWRKCSTYGTYNIVMLSPVEIPGYIEVREQYVSAYKASLQRSTLKLSSVNNSTADYRGGHNEASWDGTYRTLLNRPVTYLNLEEFRTYARNRGNGTKWNCMTYEAVRTIYWLFVTEYATLNSQAEYTSKLDANGYRQGGLGIGVSDWNRTAWYNYNGYAPLIPCGVLDEYGSGTAVKNFSIYNADTTLAYTFQCNKYRGIEMPFGDIWIYVDGVLINVESGDGVSTAYMTIDTANFSSASVANYNEICNTYRIDSYIKGIVFNPDGDIFATQNGANSTSYYCDQYFGTNILSTTELRAWRFGGLANHGAHCGLACASSLHVPGYRGRDIGSRLCFVP